MTLRRTKSGLYVHVGGSYTDPIPQVSQYLTLQAMVSGKLLVMTTDAARACYVVKMTWDGVDLLNVAADHGRGIQPAHNGLPTGEVVSTNVNSPTGQGSQRDGASASTGTSNNVYRCVYANGRRAITRTLPANWMQPNQETVPAHPALNDRLVSAYETTQDTEINWGGREGIVSFITDVVVPDIPCALATATQLDCVLNSIIATDVVFTVVEYLNPATGATRAYPGFPDTSNTEVCLISSADGTSALCPYQPLSEWGATGYAQCYSPATLSNTFIRAREVVPSGIVPGKRLYNAFMGVGTRAEVIARIVALHAEGITRSTEIALPGLAA